LSLPGRCVAGGRMGRIRRFGAAAAGVGGAVWGRGALGAVVGCAVRAGFYSCRCVHRGNRLCWWGQRL